MARYIARAPFALGKLHILPGDRVRVDTPPDPRTGATHVELDAFEFIHRVTTQIPDARRHLIRYYGAYSHRSRGARRARTEAEGEAAGTGKPSADAGADESAPTKSRASWARLVRRIYEADPLLCPRCRGPLEVISVLVDPKVAAPIGGGSRELSRTLSGSGGGSGGERGSETESRVAPRIQTPIL